jgi:hypothetical protein
MLKIKRVGRKKFSKYKIQNEPCCFYSRPEDITNTRNEVRRLSNTIS